MGAFLEVGRIRQAILEIGKPAREINLTGYSDLHQRLNTFVNISNAKTGFQTNLTDFETPFTVRIRDLVPLGFYLAQDFYSLPPSLQRGVHPQAPKIMGEWGKPSMSYVWMT